MTDIGVQKAKSIKPTKKSLEKTAFDIMDFLDKQDMWYEVCIYVNNKRFFSAGHGSNIENKTTKAETKKGTPYWIEENINVKEYLEYSNPNGISLSFEGPLYDKINYDDYDFVQKMTNKFLDKYNMYFDMGNAWNMSAWD